MVETTAVRPVVPMPRELVESPAFLAKRVGMLVKERMIAAYDAAGASPYDLALLSVLAEGACSTQATIADALAYDRSYLVGLLDELEGRSLIERRRDENDRRRHVVTLTGAGERELERLRAVHRAVEDELLEPLDAAEARTLRDLLAKVAAAHDPRYRTA